MSTALESPLTSSVWMQYALTRIRALVDKPRAEMTDTELAVYTFATNALTGGEPVIPLVDGHAARLCRICGAEWGLRAPAEHVAGCPVQL